MAAVGSGGNFALSAARAVISMSMSSASAASFGNAANSGEANDVEASIAAIMFSAASCTVRPLPEWETRSKLLRTGSQPRLIITLINSSYQASVPRWIFNTSLT